VESPTLYDYYATQDIAPTFADLRDEASMRAYQTAREALLGERLALPIPLFRGAEILEFGPDTGENAVVFARWGAHLTLVEPSRAAHRRIRAYFERFAPPNALRELSEADVSTYASDRQFDMVVAEGFIYTVQPWLPWLRAFRAALVPGGLALITYYERTASLFELLLRVPFAALRRRDGSDRLAAAERLYRRKWDRIPHTRTFESWVMDVLDNPFVRLRYFIDSTSLIGAAGKSDFGIHAAWPSYVDGLQNVWAKRPDSAVATLARTCAHLRRSVPSFLLGTKAYVVDECDAEPIAVLVDAALADADALVDSEDGARSLRLADTLRRLAASVRAARSITDDGPEFDAGIQLLEEWAAVNTLIGRGFLDRAVERLNTDPVLLDGWGTPNHMLVLRAGSSASR
jgi:hypothetical protein